MNNGVKFLTASLAGLIVAACVTGTPAQAKNPWNDPALNAYAMQTYMAQQQQKVNDAVVSQQQSQQNQYYYQQQAALQQQQQALQQQQLLQQYNNSQYYTNPYGQYSASRYSPWW